MSDYKLGTCCEVEAEVNRARSMFAPMHNPHEALAVIMEEFEEFKEEVFRFNLTKGRDTRPASVAINVDRDISVLPD